MKTPLKQEDLYHLYANIRERLHEIIKESHPDPLQDQIRREMAEELLEYLISNEEGMNNQIDYKDQWTNGGIEQTD